MIQKPKKKQSKKHKMPLILRNLLQGGCKESTNSTKQRIEKESSQEIDVFTPTKKVKKIKIIKKLKRGRKKGQVYKKGKKTQKGNKQQFKTTSVIEISSEDQQNPPQDKQYKTFLKFKVKITEFQVQEIEQSSQNKSQSENLSQQIQFGEESVIKRVLKINMLNEEKIFEVELCTGEKTNITRANFLKFFPQSLALYYESQAIIL